MTETRFAGRDLPPETLDFFALHDGVVHWASEPSKSQSFRNRRAPWGAQAGGRAVFGRGRLITFARCALLTTDLAFALSHGGEWPWQVGAGPQHDGSNTAEAATWRALIQSRMALDGGAVVWRVDRGKASDGAPQYPAGSVVAGYPLSGFRGRMLTTGGMGFLACDVVNVLKNNAFPFEWD